MLVEITAFGAAVGAVGAVGELIRRAVAEGRWRAAMEKDIQHLGDEIKRVEDSAARRITKSQSESHDETVSVESRLEKRLDSMQGELHALRDDVGEMKVSLARIVAAIERRELP